jgi:hypothetical protein
MLAIIAPDLLFNIGQSWLHTLNLASVKASLPMDVGAFLFGGVTFGIFVWITSYAFAQTYNRFSK